MDSIVQEVKECYACGCKDNLDEHHLIGGTSNRAISEKYGLKIWLCRGHHLEAHQDPVCNHLYKRLGQIYFEKTHTREEFIKAFGKSFIKE